MTNNLYSLIKKESKIKEGKKMENNGEWKEGEITAAKQRPITQP